MRHEDLQRGAPEIHTLQRIITAQEEERKRIARELHDDTGQVLTALVIQLGAAAEALPPGAERARGFLDQAAMRLKQALQDIRKLISDLRPTLLDDLGLVPALRRYLESTGAGHGMRMRLRTERLPARLPSHLETALFRIVQEGVTNAVKHAEASDVSVVLALEDGHVVARVEDNGRGFDVSKLARPQATEGFGRSESGSPSWAALWNRGPSPVRGHAWWPGFRCGSCIRGSPGQRRQPGGPSLGTTCG